MSDAAHVGSQQHIVFNKPFKVKPEVEEWKISDSYEGRRLPNEPEIPKKMKVWRVQNSGKTYGSVVARKYGFTDSPDAEIIAAGYNSGKEYGAVGIGRHGNFLQWGYSQPPSKMTEAGKNLYLNCICYIKKFDGKLPLVRRKSSHRDNALRLASLIKQIKNKSFFSATFSPDLQKKYKNDPDGLVRYYMDSYDFIYKDKTFLVDTELKDLGIDSNRKIESLQKLITLLGKKDKAETAQKLLNRYTRQSFTDQNQWQKWFDSNKGRIFFSDVGGYKFFVIPKGYMDKQATQP
ncbi:MAG: hypothetical protein FVQ79_00885 [Planctomycetes bacterium]|nr:hypothetical protein [Planctomycetota bacterium]